MAVTVAHIANDTATEIDRLRSEQNEISLAERLRWTADLLISAGRGYLISGSPELLAKVRQREADFDAAVRALEQQALSAAGAALIDEAERKAHEFRSVQAALLGSRTNPDVVDRFERELQPLGLALSRSLAELIEHKEELLDRSYADTQRDRRDLVIWTFALLGMFTSVGIGLAWYFASRLGRAYRQQQQAVAASEKALADREELMGILAHDLRNPLNSIALKAAVLRETATDGQLQRHADSIGAITAGMAELVDSILDLSTIEAGHLELELRALEVERLLEGVSEIYQSLAAAKGIRLERARADAELRVLVDRQRIVQVLSNLLGNAIKVTPAEGSIRVAAERQGAMVRFSVSDTGPGISEQHLPHIFERRWKHESGERRGTGLGLFIAKSIVDAHGGRIWHEAGQRGSIFHFTLPVSRPPRAESSRVAAEPWRTKTDSAASAPR